MNNLKVSLKKCGLSALLFAVVAMTSVSAYAIPTTLYEPGVAITDGESWSTNGVRWTLSGDAVPGVSTSGSFTLTADVTGWTNATTGYLTAFSFKNFLTSPVSLTNLTGPGTWDVTAADIAGNGCKDPNTDPDAVCLTNISGDPTTNDGIFSFTFDIGLTDVFPESLHFKVYWVDEFGNKNGDLISQEIAWVPEPGMVGLLAIGLIGMVVTRRRMKV